MQPQTTTNNQKQQIITSQKPQKQKIAYQQQYQEQEIPDHFYDSDLASVNQKDFMSDNQPPKDITHERKLLHKQKFKHIFKTIIKVGFNIDKPAPYDLIKLRYKGREAQKCKNKDKKSKNKKWKQQVNQRKIKNAQQQKQQKNEVISKQEKEQKQQNDPLKDVKSLEYLEGVEFLEYNLGIQHQQIQVLVTSMKQKQVAMFEVQVLQMSEKSNIKILKYKHVYLIEVQCWTTVIDIDGDRKLMKYVLQRGSGPHRVHKFDEVTFSYKISCNNIIVQQKQYKQLRIQQEQIQSMPISLWKILSSMKKDQNALLKISDQILEELQSKSSNKFYQSLTKLYIEKNPQKKQEEITEEKQQENNKIWEISVHVKNVVDIDDFYMDGTILKKTLIRGVSTAKPQSSSFVYYALKFYDSKKNILHVDQCFKSDWWQDHQKLEQLGCRKNHLDEYKISKFLKASIKRMKPAQVSELQCRELSLFQYGQDYEQLKKLWPKDQQYPPKKVFIEVRVYNFTEPKTCFNIQIEQKVNQAKRKKIIAVQLLKDGNIKKSYKRFQNIVALFSTGKINQQGYDQKISALMNSILCLMKQQKFTEMIPLCDNILEPPKHGYDQEKMKINGPQGLKVEGSVDESNGDDRIAEDLMKNKTIIDKCLYRKSLALARTGESKLALDSLSLIESESEQVKKLRQQAVQLQQKYEKKSKKMFQQMFG